ncbi:FecR family protein [Marinifilum fragile]|uniref:FecR family protein n=1 Tax=Marinifilum fragile TaxID=570161 RepID=UPI0006CF405B|nr:FecR domain-containing protein [Marinifilum fragile]
MKESTEKYIEKAEKWSKIILTDEGEASDQDQEVFESLKSGAYANWRKQHIHRFDKDHVKSRVDAELQINKTRKIGIPQWLQSVAAVLIIAMLAAGGYWIYSDMQTLKENHLLPGSSMAYLEIDNQEKIELTGKDTLLLFKESKAELDSGRIVYSSSEAQNQKVEYHRINVPRNGEFFVVLSDGTKVWINSGSQLGFHSKFTGKQRIVHLEGEAYFEVSKNPEQPFVVRTNNMDVRVLGTHFNVKAYDDDEFTYATLNEGKVHVFKGEMSEVLQPDEQLVLNNNTKAFKKQIVDASIYSAWVKGKMMFKDERLEDIMNSLSRWYDVSVFYRTEELKDRRFSISTNRYGDIQTLLDQMELTNRVRFEINKNAIVVKP